MSVRTEPAVETLRPGDAGYDRSARGFFTTGRPALVVRPRDPDEIAAALRRALRNGLPVSVRSGGHSPVGHSTNTGGMVIDLVRLGRVEILDVPRRLVRVGAGATWGQVTAALDPYGWALTAGDSAGVGVGGLTLGGGIGWLVRRYGLAIDNLVGARIVTADGRMLRASQEENPELFWALRGGGGNFGVVVDLDFRAQPVRTVHFGSVSYALGDAAALLRRWRDAMRAAPDELSSTLALMPATPSAPPAASVLLCYAADSGAADPGAPDPGAAVADAAVAGAAVADAAVAGAAVADTAVAGAAVADTAVAGAAVADADAAIEPLLELGTVTAARIAERRYGAILEDGQHPPGLRMATRNTLVPVLDDDVIGAVARLPAAGPAAIAVRSLGGAFGRVPPEATAFAHRDAEAMIVCAVLLPGAATDAELARALVPWHRVAARGTGTYVNFQGSATAADVAAAYPPATYARLAAVKRRYDPDNVFALNHNVLPAGDQASR